MHENQSQSQHPFAPQRFTDEDIGLASQHPQVKEFLERDFDNPSFAA